MGDYEDDVFEDFGDLAFGDDNKFIMLAPVLVEELTDIAVDKGITLGELVNGICAVYLDELGYTVVEVEGVH